MRADFLYLSCRKDFDLVTGIDQKGLSYCSMIETTSAQSVIDLNAMSCWRRSESLPPNDTAFCHFRLTILVLQKFVLTAGSKQGHLA